MATQNANQFIGSKISLISKSEIRYEGILYSLDLQDATISLAKVKSFGTEDRPTERPVPPKEEIYEFIIFRGSDIKGIDVLEPPKSAPASALHNDPAIVEVSHYHSAGQPGSLPQQQPTGFPTASTGGYQGGPFGASITSSSKLPHHNQGQSELNSSDLEQPGGISVPLESSESVHETTRSNASTPSIHTFSNRKSPVNDSGVQADDRGRNNRQYNNNRQIDNRDSRPTSQDRRRQNRQGGGGGGPADRQIGYQPRGRGNYVNNRGGGGNFRGGQRGNRGFRQGIIKAQHPAKVTFEEAFDFEKANEELVNVLSKIKIKSEDGDQKEDGEVNAESEEQENKEPAEPYYVKESFFDKISCESTERSKGKGTKPDWRAERKLNAETFGLPANQRRGGNFRGNYRGSNFRGGYGGNRGNFQRSYGGYNNYSGGYYNNRYNGGGRGGRGGSFNRSQQQQPQPQNQQAAATAQ